jgi:hypothetical protein
MVVPGIRQPDGLLHFPCNHYGRVVRDKHLTRGKLKAKAVLTAEGADLNHVVEGEIELPSR